MFHHEKKKDYTCNTNVDQEIHETDSGVITRFYCKYFISAFGVFEEEKLRKKLRYIIIYVMTLCECMKIHI